MAQHILPNTLTPIMVAATLNFGMAILTEATLSFLGIACAEPAVTGNADPYRQSVPVLRLLVDRGVSRHSALPARGCRQYAR
ncbi:hypothetical protein AB664_03345 [Brucella anthropi]|uniref:Uncharacterized protein n=1 Tax=Brucella anthropi TaxID=529 RepID=A0A656Z6E6_BRUAN|nr:hypothetical protein AB664_03345 [Brucella anthropi]